MHFQMASHHFIGTGRLAESSGIRADEISTLVSKVSALIDGSGLKVMADRSVEFDNGGATVVWVLAESHLVVHLWKEEGYATLDLHICDYQEDNAQAAKRLQSRLNGYCFAPGSESWREIKVTPPA